MASGAETSDSVSGYSVKTHGFPCTPCSEDGKNVEAVHYCENCDMYFCEQCVGHHNKVFKSHRFLDKAAIKSRGDQEAKAKSTSKLLTDECEEHPGNVIQMYCGDHDLVCCTVCIALNHRACKDVDFIPKAAATFFSKEENRNETKESLDTLCKDIEELKTNKSTELLDLNSSERDILAEIQTTKEQLVARVCELERRSIFDVQETFKVKTDIVKDELAQLDKQLLTAKNQVDSITKVKSKNEAQLFVMIKQGRKVIEKTKTLLSELKSLPWKISFVFDKRLESAFAHLESFGLLSTDNKTVSASLISEHDCKHTDDRMSCFSFGICVLDNGHILMTDYNKNKLKKLDQTFTVIDSCCINTPFSVCRTRSNEVAVSSLLCGRVLFAAIEDKLTVIKKKTIDVGGQCMGNACSKGELFVACGKYNLKEDNAINVYNLDGSLLRSMKQTNYLANLSISPDGTRLYVTCKDDGLIILDRDGKRISVSTDTRLKSAHGVCQDYYGHIYVCSEKGNSVLQIDRTGSVVTELLTQSDGIDRPVSVIIAMKPMRMMVTSWSKALQIFKLT